ERRCPGRGRASCKKCRGSSIVSARRDPVLESFFWSNLPGQPDRPHAPEGHLPPAPGNGTTFALFRGAVVTRCGRSRPKGRGTDPACEEGNMSGELGPIEILCDAPPYP